MTVTSVQPLRLKINCSTTEKLHAALITLTSFTYVYRSQPITNYRAQRPPTVAANHQLLTLQIFYDFLRSLLV